MQAHYGKCSVDSVSFPQPVVIAKKKPALSRSHSGSLTTPHKQPDTEILVDTGSHLVNISAAFESAVDTEVTELFCVCSLQLIIVDLDWLVNVLNMLRPGCPLINHKAVTCQLPDTVTG